MTSQAFTRGFHEILAMLKPPVLIISTHVGRGMYYLGEALREQFPEQAAAAHFPIEQFLPESAVAEDLKRYKFISSHFPALLYLAYKTPFVYARKFLREKLRGGCDLPALSAKIAELKPATILCVSHRAAFWCACLKSRSATAVEIWDVLGEYGNNPGYRFLFWEQISGFLSPLPAQELSLKLPPHVQFRQIELPARKAFYDLASRRGSPDKVVLICGYWGQGPITEIVRGLRRALPRLEILAICGENAALFNEVSGLAASDALIKPLAVVPNLAPYLADCAAIITKPGISTLLEAHAAQRKIFLLKGMPVAEDNNARYAVAHFGAEWFSLSGFTAWRCSENS